MIRNWFAPAVIVTLTLLFLLLWESPPQSFFNQDDAPTSTKYPASILINTVSRRYDDEGKLNSVFKASEARYFQVNPRRPTKRDYVEVKEPKLTFYTVDKPPWDMTARTGKSKNNGNLIQLKGDVHLWQSDSENLVSELTTPYLVVKPEQQYAETNKPVIISSPGSTTNAVGMKAYLQTDTIKLLSKVRGIHEP
ncbi:LPS export ABC transporter periplasmic protein LptC [Aestuariicella hydrocarbonica]|uniref:LPS export ABC transporter periplasmic protein LptC n=1 Tax=Pseudomaricurvus hydrocarbonicus TaxID=1470433 RepID=A0A9E5JY97_9GAMM|nr:LPS export ABC transporter periplasmic protein LptC [Aestuariicella hydrocarbonica]